MLLPSELLFGFDLLRARCLALETNSYIQYGGGNTKSFEKCPKRHDDVGYWCEFFCPAFVFLELPRLLMYYDIAVDLCSGLYRECNAPTYIPILPAD